MSADQIPRSWKSPKRAFFLSPPEIVAPQLLGISRDTVKAQKKFAEKYDLQYPLLADADQTICNRFGVIVEKNMYGKKVTGIERTTFVIGPDQKLLHIFSKVKPEGHAEEVLALLKKK